MTNEGGAGCVGAALAAAGWIKQPGQGAIMNLVRRYRLLPLLSAAALLAVLMTAACSKPSPTPGPTPGPTSIPAPALAPTSPASAPAPTSPAPALAPPKSYAVYADCLFETLKTIEALTRDGRGQPQIISVSVEEKEHDVLMSLWDAALTPHWPILRMLAASPCLIRPMTSGERVRPASLTALDISFADTAGNLGSYESR